MNNCIKKTPSFKKETLEIVTPMSNLPFMFSVGISSESYISTSASDRKETKKSPQSTNSNTSFYQELQNLGISAKYIPEKNPLKLVNFNKLSEKERETGLPFQRRARSSSPPRENLKIVERKNSNLFSPRSPIVLSHKLKFKEDFTGLCRNSGYSEVEEDDDLKLLKEEYRKLLEGAPKEINADDSDEIEDEGEIEKIETKFGFKNKRPYF